ncbi:MAG: prolyl oligopeptidase family serine peptidase [Candidatus Latescibacterota bacterium]|jgi:poly(3-hydroxybutyrate) depolymerase
MDQRARVDGSARSCLAVLLPVLLLGAAMSAQAAAPALLLEGFARCDSAARQGLYAGSRGIAVASSWEYALDGTQQVAWQTELVPSPLEAQEVVFAFACGISRQAGPQQLTLDGQDLLVFTTGELAAETVWEGNGCALRFAPMLRDDTGEYHGVMYLRLPSTRLTPGQPARLTVRGLAGGNGSWFMLHHYTDAHLHARTAVLALSSGRRLQVSPPQRLFVAPRAVAWDCPVLLGGAVPEGVERVAVQARLLDARTGTELTSAGHEWTLDPQARGARLELWPVDGVPEGDHHLEITFTESGAQAGQWEGMISVRRLTELNGRYRRTAAVLEQVEHDPGLSPLIREVTAPTLAGALERLRKRVDAWAEATQLDSGYAQVLQEVAAVTAEADQAAAGRDPLADRTGFRLRAYRSELDGRLQPYALLVPSTPPPARGYPLVVALHGFTGNPEGSVRVTVDFAGTGPDAVFPDRGFVVVAPYNRDNIGYTGELGEDDVWRVIAEARRACAIDEDRIYLTGLSMGGGGTLHLGLRYPDRFAAIAAICGWSDWHVWAGGGESPSPVRQRVLDSVNILAHAENALNLPVALYHGGADSVVSPEHSRVLFRRLRELGYRVEHEEYPGVGHNSWDQAYEGGRVLDWLGQFVREPYPRRVVHLTADPVRYGRAYWTSIEELIESYRMGRLEAIVEGRGRVVVRSANLGRFSLTLGPALVDTTGPVTVEVDGVSCFAGRLPRDGVLSFVRSGKGFALTDQPWQPTLVPVEGLDKAGSGWHLFVYGTGGAEAEREGLRRTAERLATVEGPVDIAFPVLADTALGPEEMQRANLVLLGTPATNSVLAGLADDLPVRFDPEGITLADRRFTEPDLLVAFTCPNPRAPEHRLEVLAATGSKVYEAATKLGWAAPDYLVSRPDGTVVLEGLFGVDWKPLPAESSPDTTR